jgi:hypothetical protein
MTYSVSWKRLLYTDECGLCHQKGIVICVLSDHSKVDPTFPALAAAGTINHGLEASRHARGQTFNIRTDRQPRPNALALFSGKAGS